MLIFFGLWLLGIVLGWAIVHGGTRKPYPKQPHE